MVNFKVYFFIILIASRISAADLLHNEESNNFLRQKVVNQFPTCVLFFVETEQQFSNQNLVNDFQTHSGNFRVNLILRLKYDIPEYSPVKIYFQKFTTRCIMTIISFEHPPPLETFTQLESILAHRHLPLFRKDKDFLVFLSNANFHRELLTQHEFIRSTKYKLAYGENGNGQPMLSTFNPFAEEDKNLIQWSGLEEMPPSDKLFMNFYQNLNGHMLQTVTYRTPFVDVVASEKHVHGNIKGGLWKYLIVQLGVQLNFTFHCNLATGADGKPGTGGSGLQLPNGTWIGLLADVLYGRADFGLGIAETPSRAQYVQFTNNYFETVCLTFVTAQPKESFSTFAMVGAFKTTLWLGLILATILVWLFGEFMAYLENHIATTPSCNSIQASVLVKSFFGQGSDLDELSVSLEYLLGFWMFFTLIMSSLYQSKLVTLLAIPTYEPLPKTFEQLANSKLDIGFMKVGDAAYNTLRHSNNTAYKALVGKMEVIPGQSVECVERVIRRENYACVAYDGSISHEVNRNFSDHEARKLVYSNFRTFNSFLGLVFPGNSPYKDEFDKAIGQYVAQHLADVWREMNFKDYVQKQKVDWWISTNQTNKLAPQEEDLRGLLSLDNIKGVFYIAGVMLFASTIAFFYEKMTACCGKIKGNFLRVLLNGLYGMAEYIKLQLVKYI